MCCTWVEGRLELHRALHSKMKRVVDLEGLCHQTLPGHLSYSMSSQGKDSSCYVMCYLREVLLRRQYSLLYDSPLCTSVQSWRKRKGRILTTHHSLTFLKSPSWSKKKSVLYKKCLSLVLNRDTISGVYRISTLFLNSDFFFLVSEMLWGKKNKWMNWRVQEKDTWMKIVTLWGSRRNTLRVR